MNCNTCQYELSQCLDGRLPSGRRAVVMQHIASCESCDTFWKELQAAQQLVLRLPREKVSSSFREQLWERIRAGEGTPDAVFGEAVPMLAKIRYSLTGAAAAAAILMLALWLNDGEDGNRILDTAGDASSTEIADNSGNNEIRVGPMTLDTPRIDPLAMLTEARPLTASLVAGETARQFEDSYFAVNHSLRQLSQQRDSGIVERILSNASDMHDFAAVLLELHDQDHLSFRSPEVAADLRIVTRLLGQASKRQNSFETVQDFVAPAIEDSQRLGNMTRQIRVTPPGSIDPGKEAAILVRITTLQPQVLPKLFIVYGRGDQVSQNSGPFFRQNVFQFQIEDPCGVGYVAPRSRIEQRVR